MDKGRFARIMSAISGDPAAMLAVRRGVRDVEVAPDAEYLMQRRRAPGQNIVDEDLMPTLKEEFFDADSPPSGVYDAKVNAAFYPPDTVPTKDHEIFHAYSEAARNGMGEGLPITSRIVGAADRFGATSLSTVLDEVFASRVGNSRRMRAGEPANRTDWGYYARHFGDTDPAAARYFRAIQAAQLVTSPEVLRGAAIGAGITGGAAALSQLRE